jgi:hypothetical protein
LISNGWVAGTPHFSSFAEFASLPVPMIPLRHAV